MANVTTLAVGTSKGLFRYARNGAGWTLGACEMPGWEVSTVCFADDDRLLAATVHWSYGAAVRENRDPSQPWTQLAGRPSYAEGSTFKLNRIWQIVPAGPRGSFYAGIDEAALFVSNDDAMTWAEVSSLTADPTRKNWYPGGGGLCLHTIVVDATDPNRLWVAISAVGCFRSDDAGKTWTKKVAGLPTNPAAPPEPAPAFCVHRIVQHPNKPDTLFMQFHGGVYRSDDAADSWQKIESGLPSNFGFPMVVTPKGTLILAPLKSDEQRTFADGESSIYRSTDEGVSWNRIEAGLPTEPTFSGVLRDSMCLDINGNIYFGTTSGQVFASTDDGESWERLPGTLPRVLSVRAKVS